MLEDLINYKKIFKYICYITQQSNDRSKLNLACSKGSCKLKKCSLKMRFFVIFPDFEPKNDDNFFMLVFRGIQI